MMAGEWPPAEPGATGPGGADTGLADAAVLQKALAFALAHVNRRERTEAEVRAHLERKGVGAEHAEAAVAALLEQRLIDDARFAEMYVSDRRTLDSWGGERIRRGLTARGVDRPLVEAALAASSTAPEGEGSDGEDGELGRALGLLRRRFPDPPRDRRERDRAIGVLLRKGYPSELALDALARHARAG